MDFVMTFFCFSFWKRGVVSLFISLHARYRGEKKI